MYRYIYIYMCITEQHFHSVFVDVIAAGSTEQEMELVCLFNIISATCFCCTSVCGYVPII